MRKYSRKETETLINQGRLALRNTLGIPEMADRMAALGYGEAKIQEGLDMCDALEDQLFAQSRNYRVKNNHSQAAKDLRDQAFKQFRDFRRWGKTIYVHKPEVKELLGLNEPLSDSYKRRRNQAVDFYEQVLGDSTTLADFAAHGFSQADLEAGQQLIEQMDQCHEAREQSKGTAQQSTQDRHAMAGEFDHWMRSFWKIAEVATANKPQLLEQLGRVVS
jgi:hypothetical protein